MKPGNELAQLKSEFNIGDRVYYQGSRGTVIGIHVAYLDVIAMDVEYRYEVRWDVKLKIDGWQSLIVQKFLRRIE